MLAIANCVLRVLRRLCSTRVFSIRHGINSQQNSENHSGNALAYATPHLFIPLYLYTTSLVPNMNSHRFSLTTPQQNCYSLL